jgi:hypothetical protein
MKPSKFTEFGVDDSQILTEILIMLTTKPIWSLLRKRAELDYRVQLSVIK